MGDKPKQPWNEDDLHHIGDVEHQTKSTQKALEKIAAMLDNSLKEHLNVSEFMLIVPEVPSETQPGATGCLVIGSFRMPTSERDADPHGQRRRLEILIQGLLHTCSTNR